MALPGVTGRVVVFSVKRERASRVLHRKAVCIVGKTVPYKRSGSVQVKMQPANVASDIGQSMRDVRRKQAEVTL